MACASVALTITAFVQNSVIGGVTSSQVKGTAVYGDEYALAENIDMFLYLRSEEWDKLGNDLDKKLAVLSTVVNAEGRYLGFNKKVTLYTRDLDEGTLGYYSPDNNAIYLDTNHILNGSSREVLESCLHECFHVAQGQYADLYNSLDEEDKNMYFLMDAKELAEDSWQKSLIRMWMVKVIIHTIIHRHVRVRPGPMEKHPHRLFLIESMST